jgi:SP family facilitated glucose transporter-like MFS transporter 8
MNYDQSDNMYSTIFQVSAAGTCLGCLLVGLSFLTKVWFLWKWFHPDKVSNFPFVGTISLNFLSLEQEHHWGKDLNLVLALAGILVHYYLVFIIYFLVLPSERSLSPSLVRTRAHTHKLLFWFLKVFVIYLRNQIFGGSFSLGMGGIPWVIMSEVPFLP